MSTDRIPMSKEGYDNAYSACMNGRGYASGANSTAAPTASPAVAVAPSSRLSSGCAAARRRGTSTPSCWKPCSCAAIEGHCGDCVSACRIICDHKAKPPPASAALEHPIAATDRQIDRLVYGSLARAAGSRRRRRLQWWRRGRRAARQMRRVGHDRGHLPARLPLPDLPAPAAGPRSPTTTGCGPSCSGSRPA